MQPPPESAARLSVAIVLFDSPLPLLLQVLDDLERAVQWARRDGLLDAAAVTVVDNGAGAGAGPDSETAQALAVWAGSHTLALTYRPQPSNEGFGAGHNVAFRDAASDYHLVLNPDVELAPEALARGLDLLAREPDIALLSPYVAGPDGRQQFLCKRYPSVLVLLVRGLLPVLRPLFAARLDHYEMRGACSTGEPVDVEIASGCFMLVRTAALRAAGGFDEGFFLYFEDFDLSLRLREQGRLVFCPQMRIVHHGGFAARKGWRHIRYFLSSGVRFFNRYGWRLA